MNTLEELIEFSRTHIEPNNEDFQNRKWTVCDVGQYLLDCDHETWHDYYTFTQDRILHHFDRNSMLQAVLAADDAFTENSEEWNPTVEATIASIFLVGFMLGRAWEKHGK